MRQRLNLAAFLAVAVGSLSSSSAGKIQGRSVAAELGQIEQQLAKAVVEGDLATYGSILASDWTVIDPAGRLLDKSQIMQELASRGRQIEAAVIDDIRVRELGEVAVVTGRTTATGSYRGQRSAIVLRFTDVFVKRDGRWQVVASQGTAVAQ